MNKLQFSAVVKNIYFKDKKYKDKFMKNRNITYSNSNRINVEKYLKVKLFNSL